MLRIKKRSIGVYFSAARRLIKWPVQKMLWGGVGPFCEIIKPIRIVNRKRMFLGRNVRILDGARLEVIENWAGGGQIQNESPRLLIEDGVSIGQNCHIISANRVTIKKGCLLSSEIYISDCEHGYENIDISPIRQPLKCFETEIGENSFLGTGVKVMAGVHIGRHCVIGSNSVVTKDIPEYSVAAGVPARVIKRYDFADKKWRSVN